MILTQWRHDTSHTRPSFSPLSLFGLHCSLVLFVNINILVHNACNCLRILQRFYLCLFLFLNNTLCVNICQRDQLGVVNDSQADDPPFRLTKASTDIPANTTPAPSH
jgi:hypothetical protein